MNQDMELKLMAYVDGELSGGEAKSVAELLRNDEQARALEAEVRLTKSLLAGNESEVKIPESREFYWSKIQRAIESGQRPAEAANSSIWFAWRRWLAPMAGVALVVFLSVAAINDYDFSFGAQTLHAGEVVNHSEFTSSLSFRSHAENMFVVWVSDKSDESIADADFEPEDDEAPAK